VIFSFIDAHKGQWPVRLLCDALGVSSAGYYAWRDRPAKPSGRQQRQDALLVQIRAIHAECQARYGSPRIHAALVAARGQGCCVNTVAKLMRDHDIRAKTAKKKFRAVTTDSDHDLPVAENLLDRPAVQPRGRQRGMGRGHHLHPDAAGLAVPGRRRRPVLAAGGRLVDGRAAHLESRLVVDALELAVQRRLPAGGGEGLLAHSDRGSQYASEHYQLLLARRGTGSPVA
jgi:transposase InsO family protein